MKELIIQTDSFRNTKVLKEGKEKSGTRKALR
jgi:hypothetical protein